MEERRGGGGLERNKREKDIEGTRKGVRKGMKEREGRECEKGLVAGFGDTRLYLVPPLTPHP